MNKKYTYIGGIIVAILILIGGYFIYENEREELKLVREEQKSSAEIKNLYKQLSIGNNIEDIEKNWEIHYLRNLRVIVMEMQLLFIHGEVTSWEKSALN